MNSNLLTRSILVQYMPISFNRTAFKLAKLLFFMYELVSVIKSEISFIAFGVFIESFNKNQ